MGDSLQKAFVGVMTLGVCCIAIELVPLSRQAAYWNRCFDNTVSKINEIAPKSNKWDRKTKHSLAVGICNGGIYKSYVKDK
tara:strand:- start:1975 stop:2217 length:243 start_codon:yes stop_codon:yes gene_type:complete